MDKNIYRLGQIEIELNFLMGMRGDSIYAGKQVYYRIDALKTEKRQILACL